MDLCILLENKQTRGVYCIEIIVMLYSNINRLERQIEWLDFGKEKEKQQRPQILYITFFCFTLNVSIKQLCAWVAVFNYLWSIKTQRKKKIFILG